MNLPTKFVEKYQKLLKEDFDDFISGFTKPRSYGLRLNTLKCTRIENNDYLKSILSKNELVLHGFYYDHDQTPGRHPYHHAGVYYLQDPSAMMVIENADIKLNDVVLDMCAAPGGKSTHILSKLNNTGLLFSNEMIPKRAKVLSENIERMGPQNAIVMSIDPQKLSEEFYGFFDKVIIDAPCSGEGMFRKDEDAVNMWSEENVVTCSLLQTNLLDSAYNLVKQNGLIIYSTCTFSPEENEYVITQFLNRYKDLALLPTIKHNTIAPGMIDCGIHDERLENCSRFYYHQFNGEGHFVAKLRKTLPSPSNKLTISKSLKKASQAQLKLLNEFIHKYLIDFEINTTVYDFNNNLYCLNYSKDIPNLDKISILRYGLHLGEIKKDRFDPSHSLALVLKKEQARFVVNFPHDSEEILKYLCGETIYYPGNNHFTLLCVDGFSLGWVKHVDNTLKNYYPKGLRIMK